MQIPNFSANVGEGLRLQGPLLCALFAAAQTKIGAGAQKKRKTPVALDSELWVIYPNAHMFGTFSGQPNNFNKQNFIDIIANNGRFFSQLGIMGLFPLLLLLLTAKVLAGNALMPRNVRQVSGARTSWWVTVFHLFQFFPRLLYFALIVPSVSKCPPCFKKKKKRKKSPCRPPAFYCAVKIIQGMLRCACESAGREKSEGEAEL